MHRRPVPVQECCAAAQRQTRLPRVRFAFPPALTGSWCAHCWPRESGSPGPRRRPSQPPPALSSRVASALDESHDRTPPCRQCSWKRSSSCSFLCGQICGKKDDPPVSSIVLPTRRRLANRGRCAAIGRRRHPAVNVRPTDLSPARAEENDNVIRPVYSPASGGRARRSLAASRNPGVGTGQSNGEPATTC